MITRTVSTDDLTIPLRNLAAALVVKVDLSATNESLTINCSGLVPDNFYADVAGFNTKPALQP